MTGPNVESVNGRAHHEIEEHLKSCGLQWCILSPGLFMQNIVGQAANIKNDGKIVQPWPKDLSVALIDVRDTGALGARVLRDPGKHAGKVYSFTGASTTYGDFANEISEVLGKPITYVALTLEQAEQGMKARGMPDWLVAHLACDLARGRQRRVLKGEHTADSRHRRPLADHDAAVRAGLQASIQLSEAPARLRPDP